MEVITLLSDLESDEEVTFISHHIRTSRQPLTETTNQPNKPNNPKQVYFGEVEFEKEKIVIKPLQDLPHFRFQCELHTFSKGNFTAHCDMCFCFLCDEPAQKCGNWATHCRATDRNLDSVRKREANVVRRQRARRERCNDTRMPR